MANFEARSAEAMELTLHSMGQGHAFVMEQGRLAHLEGKIGFREGLTVQRTSEMGGGQARAHLPGGMGGVPTVVPSQG